MNAKAAYVTAKAHISLSSFSIFFLLISSYTAKATSKATIINAITSIIVDIISNAFDSPIISFNFRFMLPKPTLVS